MSEDWDNWMIENNFIALNSTDSFTRKSVKEMLSSPDITIAPVQWLGSTSWTPLTKQPGGSDHIPLLINIRLNKYAPAHQAKRSNKKRSQRNCWRKWENLAFQPASTTGCKPCSPTEILMWTGMALVPTSVNSRMEYHKEASYPPFFGSYTSMI